MSPAIAVYGWCKPSLAQIELQLFKWGHFHIFSLSYNLISDDLWPGYMTFDYMNIWRFSYYINNHWFQTSTFQMRSFSHFHLTTWPQMTFDPGIWPLMAWTHEGSQIISISQVWFHLDFNYSNEAIFTLLAYLTDNLTSDDLWLWCDLWPHQQMRVPMLHLWPNFGWNPSKHVEVKLSVNPFSQQTTTTTDSINKHQQTTAHKVIPMWLSC